MEAKIEVGKIKDVLKDTVQEFRDHLHSDAIHDGSKCTGHPTFNQIPTCLTICPHPEEVAGLLEELIPSEEILSSSSIVRSMTDERTLSDEEKELICKLFKMFETTYDKLGRACGLIGALS